MSYPKYGYGVKPVRPKPLSKQAIKRREARRRREAAARRRSKVNINHTWVIRIFRKRGEGDYYHRVSNVTKPKNTIRSSRSFAEDWLKTWLNEQEVDGRHVPQDGDKYMVMIEAQMYDFECTAKSVFMISHG